MLSKVHVLQESLMTVHHWHGKVQHMGCILVVPMAKFMTLNLSRCPNG